MATTSLRRWSISFWTLSEIGWPLVACAIVCCRRLSVCAITESTSLWVWASSRSCLIDDSVGGALVGEADGLSAPRTSDAQSTTRQRIRVNMGFVRVARAGGAESGAADCILRTAFYSCCLDERT